MKDKSYLVLMEQLMMIVIFAVISALCIQVFIKANQISKSSQNRDKAVIIVQNAAESIKAGENIEDTYYDESWSITTKDDFTYQLKIDTEEEMTGLEKITIRVTDQSLNTLFEIKIARQVEI
ncbi:MAG: hypothetical protein NC548_45800 [Lachnospiraceae bacterium]|nr:hypothetical protein [Lachnospiraceae bacterium]